MCHLEDGGSTIFRSFTVYQTMRHHIQGNSKLGILSRENLKLYLHTDVAYRRLKVGMRSLTKYCRLNVHHWVLELLCLGGIIYCGIISWQHCGKEETRVEGCRG